MNKATNAPGARWRGAGREALRSLVRLAPSPGQRWRIALRSALALTVPIAILTLWGRPDLGLQAAAGGFVAIYASSLPPRERARVLPFVAAVMFACAVLGTVLSPWPWGFALGLVGVTLGVAALAFAFRLGPPGPVFFVLIFGLSATITAETDGVRRADPLLYLAVLAGAMLFAYAISVAPMVLPSERRRQPRPLRELLPGPWVGPLEQTLLLRVAVATVVATVVSLAWLDPARAYWTVATAVTVIGLVTSRRVAVGRGLHRTVGTLMGALCYLLLAPLGSNPLVLLLLLFVLQFGIEFFVVRNYGLALVLITPLVLFINAAAAGVPDARAVAIERVIDTVVGSLIGVCALVFVGKRSRI